MLQSHLETKDQINLVLAKIKKALDHLRTLDLQTLAVGRYEIEGSDLFFMIDEYETVPADQMRFESHLNYLDIQGVISGHEVIWVAKTDTLAVNESYDPSRDIAFYQDCELFTAVTLEAGDYVVLMPEDAHKPKIMFGQPEKTKKYVVKIRI